MPTTRLTRLVPVFVATALVVMVAYANWRDARKTAPPPAPQIGAPGGPTTSREGLDRFIAVLEGRLKDDPADVPAAVTLADALMRQARVESDAALVIKAEQMLKRALDFSPEHYLARRMLGTVYLAQHRFKDAIASAERARTMEPRDAWNYGVIGDANLELGEYEKAFAAFDRMSQMRPSAATYARVAYARELQGDFAGALKNMQMAADATSATDLESLAWHYAQIGNLYFQMGRLAEARREFQHAVYLFPAHPYALTGLARVKAAQGDLDGALAEYRAMLDRAGTPELAAAIGDVAARKGDREEAERHYELAERLERAGWQSEEPQPAALARFLAERGRKTGEAVRLAEQAAAARSDIFTQDALAWSYFRAGRLQDAQSASARALRTGTRDRRILYHAAAIKQAAGDRAGARELVGRALEDHPEFDPLIAPAATALQDELSGASRQAT